jgi:hypothetical protein
VNALRLRSLELHRPTGAGGDQIFFFPPPPAHRPRSTSSVLSSPLRPLLCLRKNIGRISDIHIVPYSTVQLLLLGARWNTAGTSGHSDRWFRKGALLSQCAQGAMEPDSDGKRRGGSGGQIKCRYRRIRWKRNPSRSCFSREGFLVLLRTHHQGYRRQVIPFTRPNFRGEGVRTVIPKGESKLWVDGGTAEVTHFGSSIVSSFLVLRQLSFAMIRTHGQRRCRARALPDPVRVQLS